MHDEKHVFFGTYIIKRAGNHMHAWYYTDKNAIHYIIGAWSSHIQSFILVTMDFDEPYATFSFNSRPCSTALILGSISS